MIRTRPPSRRRRRSSSGRYLFLWTAYHGSDLRAGRERYDRGGASAMDSTILDLGEDLSGFLATLGQPIGQTAREMIVFELYRRSLVSSGKAAELLGIPRLEFVQRASELGIPYFRFNEDEWQAEVVESKRA